MEDLIKIKCPYCGAVLSVRNQPGIESKSVTCPICKQKSPFNDFKRIVEKSNEERTQYPGEEHTRVADSGNNHVNYQNLTLGKLRVMPSGPSFQLKPGKNIVGRRATQSSADFQIPTGENKRMSREHLVIEVKKVPGKGFIHYASLCKQKTNKTLIGNEQLEYGDCVVLNHGDIIKCPDVNIKFEIPDEDGTEF